MMYLDHVLWFGWYLMCYISQKYALPACILSMNSLSIDFWSEIWLYHDIYWYQINVNHDRGFYTVCPVLLEGLFFACRVNVVSEWDISLVGIQLISEWKTSKSYRIVGSQIGVMFFTTCKHPQMCISLFLLGTQ